MDDKIIVAIVSTVFGFSLPYLANIWTEVRRSRRMVSALDRELSEVATEIERKILWVGRNVSEHLNEVDKERIVESGSTRLYLGEREEFVVPRPYWKAKYTEIAEAISDKDFSDFYVMYRLVDRFEQKFDEMKLTFESKIGNKGVMAFACFKDLQLISNELRAALDSRLRRCS